MNVTTLSAIVSEYQAEVSSTTKATSRIVHIATKSGTFNLEVMARAGVAERLSKLSEGTPILMDGSIHSEYDKHSGQNRYWFTLADFQELETPIRVAKFVGVGYIQPERGGQSGDPIDLNWFESGSRSANINLKIYREGKGQDKRNDFFSAKAWDYAADTLSNYFKTGDQLGVSCTFAFNQANNGKTYLNFTIQRVEFINSSQQGRVQVQAEQSEQQEQVSASASAQESSSYQDGVLQPTGNYDEFAESEAKPEPKAKTSSAKSKAKSLTPAELEQVPF